MRIVTRAYDEAHRQALLRAGLHPVLARIYAARRIASAAELDTDAARLVPPGALAGIDAAADLLVDAIDRRQRILIVADYDADGATACAVGLRALRRFGAVVDYLVPDRFRLGYGLSPELVDLAAARRPDLIVTVDNGIASVEGVARARALGIDTLITDHHLPGAELPQATCIVNPNQPGCGFPSKALAGVGVLFYVMLMVRARLRNRGAYRMLPEPNLAALTDLVALGTIADVVPLDANNRILVAQGLRRLQAGEGQPGVQALLRIAGRSAARASAFDLGFVVGPRLNAAGRLADMSLGIECLITDDPGRAANCAQKLDQFNRARREIESGMLEQALARLPEVADDGAAASCFFEADWHQGVVGILASRLRERLHRPVVCFARAESGTAPDDASATGLLRGSGRSIPGLHLRDCLDLVAKRAPGLILRFGGHAQAAGLTLHRDALAQFAQCFAQAAAELAPAEARTPVLETDGGLDSDDLCLDLAQRLEAQIWGQGFPQPVFCDTFAVERQRVVGERHLKLRLARDGRRFEAMHFGSLEPLPSRARIAYRLTVNEFNGMRNVQLNVQHVER